MQMFCKEMRQTMKTPWNKKREDRNIAGASHMVQPAVSCHLNHIKGWGNCCTPGCVQCQLGENSKVTHQFSLHPGDWDLNKCQGRSMEAPLRPPPSRLQNTILGSVPQLSTSIMYVATNRSLASCNCGDCRHWPQSYAHALYVSKENTPQLQGLTPKAAP